MATILKYGERDFKEDPNKIDDFRLFSDVSRKKAGINPANLNFDLRKLNPGQFSAPYHFHRFAEELFMIISGSATLRTPDGFNIVSEGDIIFFEPGKTGAHQLHNHTPEPCIYLDMRSFTGYDVCEYPDSDKILIVPSFEIYRKESKTTYFDGEEDIVHRWEKEQNK